MASKIRSPNYPSIDLGRAVERVNQLYPDVQRGEFAYGDAARAWNYSSVSGPVRRTMGALRQYGLIEHRKGDNAKLTTRALTLILREPESREYRSALRDAALDPPLFTELEENGKGAAAADALRQYLVVEKNFTKEGATQFIEVFHAARGLANLDESDNIAGLDVVQDVREEPSMQQAPHISIASSPEPGTRTIQIPIPGVPWPTLTVPYPMTEQTWKNFQTMLANMKSALVAEELPLASSEKPEEADDKDDG